LRGRSVDFPVDLVHQRLDIATEPNNSGLRSTGIGDDLTAYNTRRNGREATNRSSCRLDRIIPVLDSQLPFRAILAPRRLAGGDSFRPGRF
jgi:hypothetical protein